MSTSAKYLIVVGGATASGKTTLSIELAKHFNAPIISADSRQFYTEMCIGNARPSKEELQQASHYFIADRSVEQSLSAGEFAKEAWLFLEHHFQQHDYAILVGGSGLFLKAATEGLNDFPAIGEEVRRKVDLLFEEQGLNGLQKALSEADPTYYAEVDQNNPSRLRRALEVCYAGDHPFSYYKSQESKRPNFQPIYLQVTWPREMLYARINQRVDIMLNAGLEQEAKKLYPLKELASLKTVGYQEWFPYFDGEYSYERLVELIKQNSRRYAKRQLTWFRRDGYWKQVVKGDLRAALSYIHLVETKAIALVATDSKSSDKDKVTGLRKIECSLGFGTDNKVLSTVILWKRKEEGWLEKWDLSDIEHLASTVLIHECLHRSECEKIFAFVENDELQVFGFQEFKYNKLPSWLKSRSNAETSVWLWERSKQEF